MSVKVDVIDAVEVIDGVRDEVGVGVTLGEAPGDREAVGVSVLELVIDEVSVLELVIDEVAVLEGDLVLDGDLVPLLDGVIEGVFVLVREFEGVQDGVAVTDAVFVPDSLAVLDGVVDGVPDLDGDLEGDPVTVGVGVICNRRGPSKCPPPLKLPSALSYDCVPVGVIVIVGDIVGGIVGDTVSCCAAAREYSNSSSSAPRAALLLLLL